MARIRTIKPDFWTDETVGECSPTSRLLFIGTWNLADDYGNLQRSAKQIKAQLFPYDDIDCEACVRELIDHDLLIEYEVDSKKYLHIKGFDKHQKVEKKSSPRHPVYDESARCPRTLPESSPTSRGLFSGMEGNGREGKGSTTARRKPDAPPPWLAEFKAIYPKRAGDQPWSRALKAARARIAEGHTPEEFLEGARRYAAFIRAAGNENTEFVKQAATFLGPDKSFLEAFTPGAPHGRRDLPARPTRYAQLTAKLDRQIAEDEEAMALDDRPVRGAVAGDLRGRAIGRVDEPDRAADRRPGEAGASDDFEIGFGAPTVAA